MNITLRLRRYNETEPAAALFLTGSNVAGLCQVFAALGLDPTGRTFLTAEGFLLTLPAAGCAPVAGALRLRRLARHVYLPADADLVPALLDDEAKGLARDRGLVFLPWGAVVTFNADEPVEPAALIVAEALRDTSWRPLPEPPRFARRIVEIGIERPYASTDATLDAVGAVGTDPIVTDDATNRSSPATGAGTAHGVARLGDALGLGALAKFGSWLRGVSADRAQPNESLFRRQGAALLALLKEFRDGDVDQALRRSPPLGGSAGERGARSDAGDRLPSGEFSYSLGGILGPRGKESSSYWHGRQDVMAALAEEYRKAAAQALRANDYRRAALIYGKLLRDYRSAATALMQGGLYHDAAVVFVDKLNDSHAAAAAFAASGEFEEAVRLYRSTGAHAEAGDLLRRIGDEEAAVAEYRLAAEGLLATRQGHLAAGRLLAGRAERPDLALELYWAGWNERPRANALACLMEAISLQTVLAPTIEIGPALDEADLYLERSRPLDEVAQFYSFLARLADRPAFERIADDLRDRALTRIAACLRDESRRGPADRLVGQVLRSGIWPTELIGDAQFASRAAAARSTDGARLRAVSTTAADLQVGHGTVTAVCSAPGTDEVFLGFEGGEVFCFRPDRSEVMHVASYDLPVAALATSNDGSWLVILRHADDQEFGILSAYARAPDGGFRLVLGTTVAVLAHPWLTPVARVHEHAVVGIWNGRALDVMRTANLEVCGHLALDRPDASPPAAVLLPGSGSKDTEFAVLIHDGREWCLAEPSRVARHATALVWRPSLPHDSTLRSISLSWTHGLDDHVEIVGLGRYGTLHWASLRSEDGRLDLVALNSSAREGGYLAGCLLGSRTVAGITDTHIEWLRCGADRFTLNSATDLKLATAVACFASARTGELLVVRSEGRIARVRVPR